MIIDLDFRYDELKCIKGWHDLCFAQNRIHRSEIDDRVIVKLRIMIELLDQGRGEKEGLK